MYLQDDKLIKRQFHKLSKQFHPDKVANDEKEKAGEHMKKLITAFGQIKNADCRQNKYIHFSKRLLAVRDSLY